MDGPKILPILQSAYRKLYVLPNNVNICLSTGFIKKDNVFIGIISSDELKKCYRDFGDSLFFENIRSFLGYSDNKESVNDAIKKTAQETPEDMLARNNGITFRAKNVQVVDDQTLLLSQASIINGCQTTMCLVDYANQEAFVVVKVVETPDSWDVAKAANYQNRVDQIALEIATYVRPQAVKRAASELGLHVEYREDSIYDVFRTIYQERVTYDEIYYLFISLFSTSPNNVVSRSHTNVKGNLLREFRSYDPDGGKTFETLFKLAIAANKGKNEVESKYTDPSYVNIFQRFWKENKPDYRTIITILAATGCVRMNVYGNYGVSASLDDMRLFLEKIDYVLENDKDMFIRYYQYAFQAIAMHLNMKNAGKDEKQRYKTLFDDLKRTPFETLYQQVCILADGLEHATP